MSRNRFGGQRGMMADRFIEKENNEMAYKNFDTNELWTREEIEATYNSDPDLIDKYPTFEECLEYLLDLGRQRVGGVVEV